MMVPARSAALAAIVEFSLVLSAISEMEAESSSTVAACSVEPCARDEAPSAICCAPVETCAVAMLISPNILFKLLATWFIEMPIVSLSEANLTSIVKSPSDKRSSSLLISTMRPINSELEAESSPISSLTSEYFPRLSLSSGVIERSPVDPAFFINPAIMLSGFAIRPEIYSAKKMETTTAATITATRTITKVV
jgi:hypothetical protein